MRNLKTRGRGLMIKMVRNLLDTGLNWDVALAYSFSFCLKLQNAP